MVRSGAGFQAGSAGGGAFATSPGAGSFFGPGLGTSLSLPAAVPSVPAVRTAGFPAVPVRRGWLGPRYGTAAGKLGARLNETSGALGKGGKFRSFRRASKGSGRRDWTFDGTPAEWLDGGGFKDILIHPDDDDYLIALFSQAGSRDPHGSIEERDRELNRRKRLGAAGLSPRVTLIGRVPVDGGGGGRIMGYFIQERVRGRTLRGSSSKALKLVRALFEKLVAERIKLEDTVHMLDNIMIGRTRSSGGIKAFVVDAGEAEYQGPRPLKDRLLNRPDPLRAYYAGIYRDIESQLSR